MQKLVQPNIKTSKRCYKYIDSLRLYYIKNNSFKFTKKLRSKWKVTY